MAPRTRRDLLRTAGVVAGVASGVGSGGCLGLFGADGPSAIDENSPARAVPNRAGLLCHADVESLLSADGPLDGVGRILATRSERVDGSPDSSDGVLDGLSETYGLDPRKVQRVTGFVGQDFASAATADGASEAYRGVIGETDWRPEAAYESFRTVASGPATESTYEGNRVLQIGGDTLSVLDGGTVVLGSRTAVEETIAVAAGTAGGVSGRLRRAFDAADGEYARFALDLDMVPLASRVLGSRAVDAIPVANVRHAYGGLFDDGDEREFRVVVRLDSATKAEQLSAQVDSFVGIARAQDLGNTPLAGYERVVQAVETEADGKTMTATYRVSGGEFNRVAGQVFTDLLPGF